MAPGPAGDAEGDRGLTLRRLEDGQHAASLVEVRRILLQHQVAAGQTEPRSAAQVEIDHRTSRGARVDVGLQGTDQAGEVGRAAGALEPGLTGGAAVAGQRVVVEVASAVERCTADDRVVEGDLRHVDVPRVRFGVRHPGREHHQADGGTGLAVPVIAGQVVVPAEALVARIAADGPRDVHPALGHADPQAPAGVAQGPVLVLHRQVGHRREQVHGPYGVSDGIRLVDDRPVALVVLAVTGEGGRASRCGGAEVAGRPTAQRLRLEVEGLLSPVPDEAGGQVQVTPLAGRPVQLDEGELDLRVSAVAPGVGTVVREDLVDQVGVPLDDPQQRGLAGRDGVRDGGFDQMAQTVELVRVAEVGEAAGRIDDGEVGVEIAVRLLGVGEERDDVVDLTVEVRVVGPTDDIAGCFQPLPDVALPEDVWFVGVTRLPGQAQGVELFAGFPQLLELLRQGFPVDPVAQRGPEDVVDGDVGQREGSAYAGLRACRRQGPSTPRAHLRSDRRWSREAPSRKLVSGQVKVAGTRVTRVRREPGERRGRALGRVGGGDGQGTVGDDPRRGP